MANGKIPIGDTYSTRIVLGHGSENGNKNSVTEKRKRFWNPLKWILENERVLILNLKEVARKETTNPTIGGTQNEIQDDRFSARGENW